MSPGIIVALVLLVGLIAFLVSGFKTVPVGAVGIEIKGGRRTGHVYQEGTCWMFPGLVKVAHIYLRERQINIKQASYTTSDRVKLEFKTTIRVRVSDADALYKQGPGTYDPFTRESHGGAEVGGEEGNLPIHKAVENSIRESVQKQTVEDILFGGRGTEEMRERLRASLDQTTSRWGVNTVEVWMTDVAAPHFEKAFEARKRAGYAGEAKLVEKEAEISEGRLYYNVASEIVAEMGRRGQQVSHEQAMRFLASHYQNEKALEIARISAGKDNPVSEYYAQFFGPAQPGFGGVMVSPRAQPAALPIQGAVAAIGGEVPCPSCGTLNPSGIRFCDRCGAGMGGSQAMPALGGATATQRPLATVRGDVWDFGREADYLLQGEGVSRVHLRLEAHSGGYKVQDLGSSNGTSLNGQRLAPYSPRDVSLNDTLTLGNMAQYRVSDLLRLVGRG